MAVDVSQLTQDQLDEFIRTRLVVAGVDLTLLPTTADPTTGAPTQDQVLASLRSFVTGTPPVINGWRPAGPVNQPDAAALSQQAAPPLEYPSITEAWRGAVAG